LTASRRRRAPDQDSRATAAGSARPAAYGLAIDGDLTVVGATPVRRSGLRGTVSVVSGHGERALDDAERVFTQKASDGTDAVTLDRTPDEYRMRIAGFAAFAIARDGTRVACTPEAGESWHWQRVLAGHALPMAALLQGIEVLHAGGVVLETADGPRALAIAAGSHGGKSSLSVNLALRGLAMLSDDALGVEERDGGGVLVHPGVGAATLRAPEVARLAERGLADRLVVIGEHSGTVRVLLPCHDLPVPLGGVYWPHRAKAGGVSFKRLPAEPSRVLASTINLVVCEPERMERHFSVAAAVARDVPLFEVGVPMGVDAGELAAAIDRHARGLLAA
jgi:hypothetical protein